jgi:arsenic resistance protein ArsH
MPSPNRDRLVDVCEELVKVSAIVLPHFDLLGDRFSERTEKALKGRLWTQAEKEREKEEAAAAAARVALAADEATSA